MRTFKKILGYFLLSLPIIAIGVTCILTGNAKAFVLGILASGVMIAIIFAGFELIDQD
jgi:hypothetical protein